MAGVASSQIYHWENGTVQPKIGNAFRLALALDVTVDFLFGIPYKRMAREDADR